MAKQKDKKPTPPPWRQKQKDAAKQERVEERQRVEKAAPAQQAAVQPPPASQQSWPSARQPAEPQSQYRFLNPYNFVRYLPAPNIPPDDIDAQLLGRCPPPPHDRYVSLTGRITCTLEAVTPLFVSDSHNVKITKADLADGREVEHKSYRFFQYGGKDAIPATSLRGMIRSVFEAVTNSPLSVFNGEERLEYRIDPAEARRFKPGIVRSLPKDGQLGTIALCEEAKVGAYYDDPERNILDDTWHCGEEAFAIVVPTKNNVLKVEHLARTRRPLEGDGGQLRHGWVKVTGQTIDTKRNEGFFYFSGDPAKARMVVFDIEREADFNTIIHAQLHNRREDFHSQVQHETLTPGDLVYVELDNQTQVRNIALARVARLRYRHPIGDLLPAHLKPSEHYDQLDIASRVFGWVKGVPEADPKARVAYAGRVRFSQATLTEDGDKGVYKNQLSLAILGEPKPTTTLFYLRKKEGVWSETDRKQPGAAETIGYDGPNLLRGRKFYRHHGDALNRLEYERAGNRRDHQNRSVRGVRAPGNVFEFTIDFHNLAPVELGALVWILRLDDEECFHRLGYAKPLGFGSVRLQVTEMQILNPDQRYQTLDTTGWRKPTAAEKSGWIERFETAIKTCYGRSIRELTNVRDLFDLLGNPKATYPSHIHYPRTNSLPDPDGKNFEWFVANKAKSTKPDTAGPNLVLDTPSEESKGLALLIRIRKP